RIYLWVLVFLWLRWLREYIMRGAPHWKEPRLGEQAMRLQMRFCLIGSLLLFSILFLPTRSTQAQAQIDGAPSEIPPWRKVLTGEDAKRVEELEKKIEELRQAGKYTEAQ